jgi:hypothetical protein
MDSNALRAKGIESRAAERAVLRGWRQRFNVHYFFRDEGGSGTSNHRIIPRRSSGASCISAKACTLSGSIPPRRTVTVTSDPLQGCYTRRTGAGQHIRPEGEQFRLIMASAGGIIVQRKQCCAAQHSKFHRLLTAAGRNANPPSTPACQRGRLRTLPRVPGSRHPILLSFPERQRLALRQTGCPQARSSAPGRSAWSLH